MGDLLSAQGGGGVGVVSGLTTGSIPFADSAGLLDQDNPHLFWDAAAKAARFGTKIALASPASAVDVVSGATAQASCISVQGSTTNSYSNVNFFNNAGVQKGAVGYANSAVGTTLAGRNFLFSPGAGVDWVLSDGTTDWFRFYCTTNGNALEFAKGNAASVPLTGNTAKIAFGDTPTDALFLSLGTAGFKAIAQLGTPALYPGSIMFAQSNTPCLSQSSYLWWDEVNHRLVIGAQSAGNYALTVLQPLTGQECIKVRSSHAAGYSDMIWSDSSDVQKGGIGYANASVANSLASKNFFYSPGSVDWIFSDATTNWLRLYATTGAVGLEFADGASATVSAAGTAKISYDLGANKVRVSKNGAAFADLI